MSYKSVHGEWFERTDALFPKVEMCLALGDYESALLQYRAMKSVLLVLCEGQAKTEQCWKSLARAENGVARALRGLGRVEECLPHFETAREIMEANCGLHSLHHAVSCRDVAATLRDLGQLDASAAMVRKGLCALKGLWAEAVPVHLDLQTILADAEKRLGHETAAALAAGRVVALQKELLPTELI